MAQYQSFPGTQGASQSLEKLRALCLPTLRGRSFLDVGCNEGFFCGYARWDGAARVVGIDKNAASIERARRRFPDCEFLVHDWERLPPGPFDVILLASALHYADDQPALIHRLTGALAPGGTLVLEAGIAPSEKSEWVKVERAIDERFFPSLPKLKEILRHYAWSVVGESVKQGGDPVRRLVLHVNRRQPIAYLLMKGSGYGKSSIARWLFQPAGIKVVSGDNLVHSIARGSADTDPALAKIIPRDYSPNHIGKVVEDIFKAGLGARFIEVILSHAGHGDFALDAYVPPAHHGEVRFALEERGYLPVILEWDRLAQRSALPADANERARRYFAMLGDGTEAKVQPPARALPFTGTRVHIEDISLRDGLLRVRGWAIDSHGGAPAVLALDIDGTRHVFEHYEVRPRADLQRRFSLPHSGLGYRLTVLVDPSLDAQHINQRVSLYGGHSLDALSGPFHK